MGLYDRFKQSDSKGQGLVEYGLILALVSIVAVGALGGIGDKVSGTFDTVSNVDIKHRIEHGSIPVATADELNNIRKDEKQIFGIGTIWEGEYESGLSKDYIQVADIDLSGFNNWSPIGDDSVKFTGTFDGCEYIIDNLKVDIGLDDHAGLFGYAEGASFDNVSIRNASVKGYRYAGGLVGRQVKGSSVNNSSAIGHVTGYHTIGGLVGRQHRSTINNSYSDMVVKGEYNNIGGLVGRQLEGSKIEKSYANGNVTGEGIRVGGLIGENQIGSSIINTYATGTVIGLSDSGRVGGLIGQQWDNSRTEDSYAIGAVNGKGAYVGGLVGENQKDSVIINSLWAIDVHHNGLGINEGSTDNVLGKPKAEVESIINKMFK